MASGAARARARAFALAFGFRDICWGFLYVTATWELWLVPLADILPGPLSPRYLVDTLGISAIDADTLERGLQALDCALH